MHYPVQRRERFTQWVDAGFPTAAIIGANDDERQVPAVVMLDGMRRCSDVLPTALAEAISDELDLRQKHWKGRSYGEAARRLLATGTVA